MTRLQEVAHKLAMHVVGSIPRYLGKEDVPKEALDSEREILMEQAIKSGKPKNIVEKMVDGRLKKFYDEVCLLEQPFVMDDKRRVSEIVQETAKKIGLDLSLSNFLRIQVGEGMSHDPKKDFASEVADTLASA
jgi:elongation factor Ts